MKNLVDTYELPYEECGGDIKRKIRLLASPQTTGEDRVMIVHTTVPAKGISEGHIHGDSDEYILFLQEGKAVLDGEEFDVPKMGVVYAKRGVVHECRNISDSEDLELYCVFADPFKPYGIYPSLIQKTNQYLAKDE